MALAWLATRNPDAARSLGERLSRLNDGALFNKEVAQATEAASADLQAALAASDDGSPAAAQAIRAGLVVEQSRNRAFEGVMARDPLLFDNLTWVVERGAAEGRRHTLLFAHNGHVDRTGQANGAPGQKLGKLALHICDILRHVVFLRWFISVPQRVVETQFHTVFPASLRHLGDNVGFHR